MNTNGATAFFSLKGHLPNNLNDHLAFSQILLEMVDTSIGVSAEYINKECIHLENGVDFIPATDLQRKFNGQYPKETLENIKGEFYQLIGSWEKEYNIILFDQSAGYTDLIDSMMPLSTRVLLVREWNMLSLDTTRSLYQHISSLYSNMEIMCCINKIPGREYKNITNTTWNDIIPQTSGFELNQQLADQLEQGELIDIGDNEFSAILNKIANMWAGHWCVVFANVSVTDVWTF